MKGIRMDASEGAAIRLLLSEIADRVVASLPQILAGRHEVSWKPDGSPVTTSDHFVERLLREFIAVRLPGADFVGEESFDPAIARSGRYLALLDPIDGTENFCSGLKEWGVSFGLWRDREHLGSLLLLPELGEQLMTGDRPQKLRSRIVGLSSSFNEAIAEEMRANAEARVMGCAVYKLYNVARGAYCRFSNPKGAHAWDLLPGLMLALEQGCDVKVDGRPFDGQFLEPDRRYRVDVRHRYDHRAGEGAIG